MQQLLTPLGVNAILELLNINLNLGPFDQIAWQRDDQRAFLCVLHYISTLAQPEGWALPNEINKKTEHEQTLSKRNLLTSGLMFCV